MRLANVFHKGSLHAARIEGDAARLLAEVPAITSGFDVDRLIGASEFEALPIGGLDLRSPVLRPAKVICLGLNYRAHIEETNREVPDYPVLFTKFSESIIGPHDDIVAPPESKQVDYEAELAVVIGRHARRIPASKALDVVAGYTIANDVTMRDYQFKTHQWLQGKAWPRCTPLGPWIVTTDELGAADSLDIRLELDGVEMQNSNTERMIFDVPQTIAALSEFVELEAGDVILMGTPSGVGFQRDPKVLLTPGRSVRVEISGIGAIQNTVVAEDVSDIG
jgi:acylpyruvate hydrolase